MNTKQQKDPLTGELFVPKRINQRFANSANRIKYYNDQANELRHSLAPTNKPLLKTVQVLNELMKDKKEAVFHKQYLLGKGISFTVHTHFQEHDGKTEIAIYQYIILKQPNDQIKIVKK